MNSFATHDGLDARRMTMFAAQLEQQRRFRLEQLQMSAIANPAAGQRAPSPVDREISETLLRGARDALAEIEAARARILDGSYGRCVECGERLPIERLEVLPSVARCLACHRAVGP